MTGRELIKFIQTNQLEDFDFWANFADDHRCEMPIEESAMKIDRDSEIVLCDSY